MKSNTTDSLKIGYDAKRAVLNLTGLGNYSRYVIDVMSWRYPRNKYVLYTPKLKDNPMLAPALERGNVTLESAQGIFKHMGAAWRSLEVTRKLIEDDVNIYHGLSNELPLNIRRSGVASVVTIHDLIWRRIPADYKPIDRKLYDLKYGMAARNADRIIAISEKTKADILEDFKVDPDKIDVIYQGCAPIFAMKVDVDTKAEIKKKYDLPERYIISVGTVQSRKNQLQAVKAMRALPADVKLLIVGSRTSRYAKEVAEYIQRNHLTDQVVMLDSTPLTDLPALYSMAQCSVYTSRYEGFGIPVIESITAGTPVIAATGSCLEEAGGKGAIYVDPDDADALADAASKLIDSSYHRSKLVDEGQRHVKKFNEKTFAEKTMNTYTKALFASLQ